MKKPTFVLFILICLIFLSSCSLNRENLPSTSDPTNTPITVNNSMNTILNGSLLSMCDLIQVQEMETLFQEGPLFISSENGGCVIRNQWDTKSIWISVFIGEQALPAMQWHTRQLVEGWNNESFKNQAEELISSVSNNNLLDLQESRLVLYEKLEYRWERVFTVGDSAYWIMNSRAFKGILDIVSGDTYMQVGFSGFLAAQIQTELEDLANKLFSQLPEEFLIDFDFPQNDTIGQLTPDITEEIPIIVEVNKTSQEIYYGDLCENETTTIRAQIDVDSSVDNVYLVYRLVSPEETNDNWTTIFMNQVIPSTWESTLSAETSFFTYKLVNGAQLEYSIAIIYNVNKVVRSQNYRDVAILQCRQ